MKAYSQNKEEGMNMIGSVEVCKRLNISRATLERWVKKGIIQCRLFGGLRKFDEEYIEQIRMGEVEIKISRKRA